VGLQQRQPPAQLPPTPHTADIAYLGTHSWPGITVRKRTLLSQLQMNRRKTAKSQLREDIVPYRAGHTAGRKLRFIDLFCGIGGFRLAFERAGCECVFSCDWNEPAQRTYAANFGETPAGDIHKIAVADILAHDILCGGFPCQPFSIAGVSKKLSLGRKHGFEDKEQGNLFFEIASIIEHHQPKAFVLENVKNLLSHDKGCTCSQQAQSVRIPAPLVHR